MDKKKRSMQEWAMHYKGIVILITSCLMALGVVGLAQMNKNEFPDFTVRQGIVITVYPGATAEEIEEQVTEPLEKYIFSYKEVKKSKTKSYSKDGMSVIQVELNDNLTNKDEFWSKFKHGVSDFKSNLPKGVMALKVKDDFGDTSSLLIAMESKDKTYRELNEYIKQLQDSLREIESVGRLEVVGMQKEQISIYLDNQKLSQYGLTDTQIYMTLQGKGFVTTGGTLRSSEYESPVYVEHSLNRLHDVQETIIYSDMKGNTVRLKDVARVVREYPKPDSYITYNGQKCILLSLEMKKGQNISAMGWAIDTKLKAFEKSIPESVKISKITDQPKVVNDSVFSFIKELLIAICAVIIVVIILMPFRVALVAAMTIPVTIFISLGIFYAFGVELNTVTLAALIVTLGMIVDDSIVIIDAYMDYMAEGVSRWHASIDAARHFFKSIISATLAISITFFPFLITLTGMVGEFLTWFPWAIFIILFVSMFVAQLVVPILQFFMIKKPITSESKALVKLQEAYDWLIERCFRYPKWTVAVAIASCILGCVMMSGLPQRMMPDAERNQFAVEIFMPTGTALDKTAEVADSLERYMHQDERIVSIASFKGTASPRFHNAYAPQSGGPNFAQFIVNTVSNEATDELVQKYKAELTEAIPDAMVRIKQLSYGMEAAPIEVRLTGDDLTDLRTASDSVMQRMRQMPELILVRPDYNEPLATTRIVLDEDVASRFSITNSTVEQAMAMRYTDGLTVSTAWDGDYDTDVKLKSTHSDEATPQDVMDELIPAGLGTVPLRQIATVRPGWHYGQIPHRNGLRTFTIMAEVTGKTNVMGMTETLMERLSDVPLPEGVKLSYGGQYEGDNEQAPGIMSALIIAVAIIFFILLWHFKRISTASLILCCLLLCVFGAAVGVIIQGTDFGMTSILGIISLMGILVRNGIIMFDYAEELRETERLSAHDAIFLSAKRRMRPILLTSLAASMGVIPMILSGSHLWSPMGAVICYGTLITMLFILTVMPVLYAGMMRDSDKRLAKRLALEKE